ncbi:hypothetical protein P3X46_026162 [Hevea brasiliensis]|uniref:Uncharacterized protein n=1 Tax=Hevea brasiliensis TaxID=3981 RepID=A0ABQ9KVR4_HEVBR|nr:uncharacterized protein LOC110669386 [Hevea brasiliensis]XP_021686729.2 uncharacterized protein LOC110669386 [Hevea brasiliensis]XP_021686730.2 uncharacterized protein LOC110669386 [Hevea brasiliensis]KAJ9152615.1 hypothetical protein P3X46_026162 [Hevea brasiliensis]
MKLSLNLPDDDNNGNPILKAKLPISIFNQPFTSIFTTATNSFSDLQFSVSTNFPSGPSLKLSYSPPTTTTTPFSPISVSLKSGLGLFGSPHNSPLVFSAHFSLSTANPIAIIPTFSLHFKPQLGDFSLHKSTASSSDPNPDSDSGTHLVDVSHLDSSSSSNLEFGNVYVPDPAGSMGWQEVKLEPCTGKEKVGFANDNPSDIDGVYAHNGGIGFLPDRHLVSGDRKKGGFTSGVAVKARTVVPLSKRLKVNLRWGVNLPGDMGLKMPYLTVNKIGVERIEEVKETKEKSNENNKGDLELLKGMCFWMRRDLEIIEKENRDMKQILEDMRSGVSTRNLRRESTGVGKNLVPASSDRLGEFRQWKSKKSDEAIGQTELKKPANPVTDLESELQKAIKAAAS